ISMTHLVATEFARWLSERTGENYRIPTEAEWEYACRAGRSEPLSEDDLQKVAWYWDNAFDKTHPVGELEPNEFGLHDMIGNAAEWCTGLDGEPLACGGSFMHKAQEVGCGARMTPSPAWQETDPQIPKSRFWLTDGPFIGFRVLRVPDTGGESGHHASPGSDHRCAVRRRASCVCIERSISHRPKRGNAGDERSGITFSTR